MRELYCRERKNGWDAGIRILKRSEEDVGVNGMRTDGGSSHGAYNQFEYFNSVSRDTDSMTGLIVN